MKLELHVVFNHELSQRAQADVLRLVQDFKEEMEALDGTVTRADLITIGAASPVTKDAT